ncbi:MAG: KilA-N domain-containing protein [Bacteroides stercoris]|nr:KilA-N domain-containing protein [Bacteroides stercoris]
MAVEKNLIELVQVDGKELAIERQNENCWVNLTEMAKPFGKLPKDWLKQQYVKDYLRFLADIINERKDVRPITPDQTANLQFAPYQTANYPITPGDLIIVRKGNTSKYEQGTWCTDYRIAMRFAQWLDARFSVKVDTLLVRIANGELIVNDSSLFRLGGEQWVSCTDYCKAFGKSMHSFYGLIGNYPQSFCNWKGQWYMSRQLFGMKEIQARFEDRRTELRGQGDKRQLSICFPDEACMTELLSKEQK